MTILSESNENCWVCSHKKLIENIGRLLYLPFLPLLKKKHQINEEVINT